ncbi:MAG: arylesterase [Candidatus Competibacteraceae bacterium]|nr:arylesterase [Candidatus Competibacteraceae bacterium]
MSSSAAARPPATAGLAQSEAFPARLEAALKAEGVDAAVVNAGVLHCRRRPPAYSTGRWRRADGPAAADPSTGANDGLRGLDPQATEANLDAILTQARARSLKVLLTGMLAPPYLAPRLPRPVPGHLSLGRRQGHVLYPFFLDGVAAVPALNQADGIHPNPDGVAVRCCRAHPARRQTAA